MMKTKARNKSKNYYYETTNTIKLKKIKKTMQEIKKLKKLMQDNSILPKFTRDQSRSPRVPKTSFG